MNLGDTVTIAGVFVQTRNRDRRWWQFWKQRFIAGTDLQTYTVRGLAGVPIDGLLWRES